MKDFLKKAFPFLSVAAGAFGGPVGIVGAKILGGVLGKEIKAEEIQAELATLTATDEGRAKAKEAEQNFVVAMAQLGYEHVEDLERIAAADKDSARRREITVRDRMPMILASSVTAGYFVIQILLFLRVINSEMRELILRSLGTLDMALGMVLSYYFGSSSGSRLKDETIAKKT